MQVYPAPPQIGVTYVASDFFSIQRAGSIVRYFQNDLPIYTSTRASSNPVVPRASGASGAITHCQISGEPYVHRVNFKPVLDGSVSGDNFVAGGSVFFRSWDYPAGAGYATSGNLLAGNGIFDFSLESYFDPSGFPNGTPYAGVVQAGLARAPTGNQTPSGYLLRFSSSTGGLEVVEDNVVRFAFGPVTPMDSLQVRRVGTSVSYLWKGRTVYQSTVASTGDLTPFAQALQTANTIVDVGRCVQYGAETPLAWRQLDGTVVTMTSTGNPSPGPIGEDGSLLRKTRATAAYDSDAVSQDWFTGDGHFTFKFTGPNTYVGLVRQNAKRDNSEMQYFVRCLTRTSAGAGTYSISALGSVFSGSFTATQSFRVERKNGMFKFYLTDYPYAAPTLVFECAAADTSPYLVDTSFYSTASGIAYCCAFFSDSDSDGLDDQWEYENFGTLAASGTDNGGPGQDDGDGYTNAEEFLNGTDPTRPTSLFPPTAANQSLSTHGPIDVTLFGDDLDPGGVLTLRYSMSPVSRGSISNVSTNGKTFTYTPYYSFPGVDSFTYTVTDIGGLKATGTVTITITNTVPTAPSYNLSTNEDAPFIFTLQGFDPEGDLLTYSIYAAPLHGTVSLSGATFTYTPSHNYSNDGGPLDFFTYTVKDQFSTFSTPGTVSITVRNVDDDPPFVPALQNFDILENTSSTFKLTAADPEGAALTYQVTTPLDSGTISSIAPDGSFTFTPTPGSTNLASTFGFSVWDGTSSPVNATARIAINHQPKATSFTTYMVKNTSLQVVLLGSDLDTQPKYSIATPPPAGTYAFYPDFATSGRMLLSPAQDFTGTYTFVYKVSDASTGAAASTPAQATVTVTVLNSNDAPFGADSSVVVRTDVPTGFTPTVQDSDGPLTIAVTITARPAYGTISGAFPNLIYTPDQAAIAAAGANFNGFDQCSYTATDGVATTGALHIAFSFYDEPSDSTGSEFWLMFPGTFDDGTLHLALFISSSQDCTATINAGGVVQTASVAKGTVTTVYVDPSIGVQGSDAVETKGIQITAALADGRPQAISVYGMNLLAEVTDGFLGFPVSKLGNNYIVMSRNAENIGYSEFSVVATRDGTLVNILPSIDVYHAGQIQSAGSAFTVTLNKGQTYQLKALASLFNNATGITSNGDLTGTSVTSNYPIAVFSGDDLVDVPDRNTHYANMLVEQLFPVEQWGRQVVGTAFADRRYGAVYRILASADMTVVKVNGAYVTTLAKGGFYESLIDGPVQFEGSNPILVAEFATGETYDGKSIGDPTMILLPPTGKYLSRYVVSTPVGTNFQVNYANLIALTGSLGGLTLDGSTINTSSFLPIAGSGYSAGSVALTLGSHTIQGSSPVGVFMYGYAFHDSYGYCGGVSFSPLVAAPDSYAPPSNNSTDLDVLSNDVYTDRSAVILSVESAPLHGSVTVNSATNKLTYTPNGFVGTDQFSYRIQEGNNSSVAVVVLFVGNSPPHANNDAYSIPSPGTPVTLAVLQNDTDPDGDPLVVVVVGRPAHGTAQINADGSIAYTSTASYHGADSFTYTVSDGKSGTSTATVNLTIP